MKTRKQNPQGSRGITRRDVLRLGAGVAAGAAVGPFVLRVAGAGEAFNWQRFKGSKIFIQFTKNPWADTMEKLLPDFEKQTGIKAEFATLPEIQARQKLTVEFTAGSGGIDVWYTSMHVEKRRFWKSGWYYDVSKFLKDPTMTAPDYDWNDMAAGAKAIATQSDGSISGLPAFVDPWILFYRKDLFAQKGLKPPKTLAEMEEFAQKFHDAPKFYGFVARGLKNANAPAWDWVLFSMGGNFQTKDGKASIDTPEAVKAMDYYAGMLKRFAPPGVVNFNWYECSSAFMQDQVAQYFDGVNFASQFEDKEKSKVAGKVGLRGAARRAGRPLLADLRQRGGGQLAEQGPGAGLLLRPVGHLQAECGQGVAGGHGQRPDLGLERPRGQGQGQDAGGLVPGLRGQPEDRPAGPARDRGRHRVPGHHRRGHPEGHRGGQVGRRARGRPEGVPGGAGQDREVAAGDRTVRGARESGRPGRAGGALRPPSV